MIFSVNQYCAILMVLFFGHLENMRKCIEGKEGKGKAQRMYINVTKIMAGLS